MKYQLAVNDRVLGERAVRQEGYALTGHQPFNLVSGLLDHAPTLMTGLSGLCGVGKPRLALPQVQIRSANSATLDADQYLSWGRLWHRPGYDIYFSRLCYDCSSHGVGLRPSELCRRLI